MSSSFRYLVGVCIRIGLRIGREWGEGDKASSLLQLLMLISLLLGLILLLKGILLSGLQSYFVILQGDLLIGEGSGLFLICFSGSIECTGYFTFILPF